MATKAQQQEFLNKIVPLAQADMKSSGILASLTIAQAILESGWGLSGLTVKSNNLFGIKGKGTSSQTFEYINGERVDCSAEFKAYPSWASSVADHSALFNRLARYTNLRGCKDYKTACKNVQADGYATAPTYADSLIKLIEQYGLSQYDGALAPTPKFRLIIATGTRGECETILNWVREKAPYAGAIEEVK